MSLSVTYPQILTRYLLTYFCRRFPIDSYTWTDENGKQEQSKESVNTPSTQWQWVSQGVLGVIELLNVNPQGLEIVVPWNDCVIKFCNKCR